MRRGAKAADLDGHKLPAPKLTLDEAAERLGMTVDELRAWARLVMLEPTYSIEELADHWDLGKRAITKLVKLGRDYGARLHPVHGGLWPTFKPTHKSRRIPLSAIERHLRHMDKEAAA
jgi:uncharacterized ferritin-like protein (DUF455 family)